MENEVLRAAAEQRGAPDPAREAAEIAMEHHLPVAVVCRLLGAPRSTVYARRQTGGQPSRPGPVPPIGDQELLGLVRRVLKDSPFAGEGYRKVRARLRREHGVHVSGNGSCGCCAAMGCSPHNEPEDGADRGRMTGRR